MRLRRRGQSRVRCGRRRRVRRGAGRWSGDGGGAGSGCGGGRGWREREACRSLTSAASSGEICIRNGAWPDMARSRRSTARVGRGRRLGPHLGIGRDRLPLPARVAPAPGADQERPSARTTTVRNIATANSIPVAASRVRQWPARESPSRSAAALRSSGVAGRTQ